MEAQVWNSVSTASTDERVAFIRKTYAHLLFAILAFVGIEVALFATGLAEVIAQTMLSVSWLLVLGLFMGVGWLADWWAHKDTSPGLQYMGLILYVVAEAIIFVPILYIASAYSDPSVIPSAAVTTLLVFAGLTVSVFATKKDFSFLRSGLMIAGFLAIGLIVAASLFGFELGLLFSVAMAGLAAGYVLYYTSNVLHHYNTNQHVAASLALFSAVALLFWYILRIFMSRD
ncbi:permease [Microvenator marinus]|uniref:Permease n=1 Tax=Microvenator marinus TaxID=2600177 RepID=A0A5B8XUM8_9DELT|nr:Bax inhibitor-1 family protein [Microvenator marinus]QED27406.1 permease [Microvenator marinus]